jgi:uncharacterized protein (TIGR01777 family)
MKVAVLGGSGLIGSALVDALRARGDEIAVVSLRDPVAAAKVASSCDAIVNLAGASVSERWTAAHKRAILSSRTDLPNAFFDALGQFSRRPATYVSASGVGYYGMSRNATFVETDAPGTDFLAKVCVAWESTASRATALGMRLALIRTGIVLARNGGALGKLLPIFRLGLGGIVASGEQWYSWIHITDQVGIIMAALDGQISGPINATAPSPVTNRDFTRELAAALHRPALFPVPAAALQLLLGEGACIVTEGQRVLPAAALSAGYCFSYPTIDRAFAALVG